LVYPKCLKSNSEKRYKREIIESDRINNDEWLLENINKMNNEGTRPFAIRTKSWVIISWNVLFFKQDLIKEW
jgi:hypothetical protein